MIKIADNKIVQMSEFQHSESTENLVNKCLLEKEIKIKNIPKIINLDRLFRSPAMDKTKKIMNKIISKKNKAPVLITGETGVGKEVIARALHMMSDRLDEPFIVVNCGAIAEHLVLSELFGHEKGSFTGATVQQLGKIEKANGGTVVLDEIGELPLKLQTILLRFLQEGIIERIGGKQPVHIDVRVIAITNKNIEQAVKQGTFREDLYYRLNAIRIEIPPLRERPEDVLLIANYCLAACNLESKRNVAFSEEAKKNMISHNWPGNIRDLKNAIIQAELLCENDIITSKDLSIDIIECKNAEEKPDTFNLPELGEINIYADAETDHDIFAGRSEIEKQEIIIIINALDDNDWVRKYAAKDLGINRKILDKKIRKYKITCPIEKPDVLKSELEKREIEMIERTLKKNDGVQSKAAAELGISRRIMNYKIQKYKMTNSKWRKNK